MKFSVIFEAQLADPTVEREHQVIRDCVEQAGLAEQMGFDRIWAVEHHSLKWYAHMSAPEIFPLRMAKAQGVTPGLRADGGSDLSRLVVGRSDRPQGLVKGSPQALHQKDEGGVVHGGEICYPSGS